MEPVVAAFLLALVHIFAGKLRFLEGEEELPERRQSRFSAFALGAAGYAAILQLV